MTEHTPGKLTVEPSWLHLIPESHLGRMFGWSIHEAEQDKYFQTIASVPLGHKQSEANASRLALAWNTHDELVEALKAMLEAPLLTDKTYDQVQAARRLAHSALTACQP